MDIFRRGVGVVLIVIGAVVAVHMIAQPLYDASSEASPHNPIWSIINPFMALAVVLGVIFGYIRKRGVEPRGRRSSDYPRVSVGQHAVLRFPGRDDKADEAAIFAGIQGTVGCPACRSRVWAASATLMTMLWPRPSMVFTRRTCAGAFSRRGRGRGSPGRWRPAGVVGTFSKTTSQGVVPCRRCRSPRGCCRRSRTRRPGHPVQHHADPPCQGNGCALLATELHQTLCPGLQPVRPRVVQHHRGGLVERGAKSASPPERTTTSTSRSMPWPAKGGDREDRRG